MFKISPVHYFWCLVLGLLISPVASIAQTVFLNFDAPGQFTGNFSLWEDTAGVNGNNYSFEENSTDGDGGGGGVAIFQNNDTTATFNGTSWSLSTNGAAIIESFLLYTDGQTSGDKIQFGVVNSTTNGLNNNAGVAFESFRFIPSSATTWGLYEQFRTNNNLVTGGSIGSVTVSTGHWYKFVVGITNTDPSSGTLSGGCALYDYGADGLTPGANLITFSSAVSHPTGSIATSAALWPAFRAFEDAGISAVDNFLIYTPASLPVITFPLTNSTVTAGSAAAFAALADGPGLITYAWYTNGVQAAGLSDSTLSISSIPGNLTNVTVVAANGNGSVTNQAAITVASQSLPQVANAPATAIGATAATLNGQVLSTGGAPTTVVFYWGETDGGTNAGAWANHISLGVQGGAFAETVQSLSTNSAYFFTCSAVNGIGTAWATPSLQFTTLASNAVSTAASVLTYQYDNTRNGVNSNETILTPQNVNTSSFGRLFSENVDGLVYAQPLIVPNVVIPGAGTHNVLYVATEHDSIYAFDADDNTGANATPLWHTSFLGTGVTTVPSGNVGTADITPEIGITSTPVIDPVSGTLYVEVKTFEQGATYVHRLHALDITTGLERTTFNSPVVIQCNNYLGTGTPGYTDNDGKNPPHVLWNPQREHCRPAMTLLNGMVYLSFASHGDNQPYHGWFFGYNATNFSITPSVYNSTPNGGLGGFWDGGGGPSVDAQGNLYFQTGNGDFNGTSTISKTANYAMSLIKFSTTNGLTMVDYFSPSNAVYLSGNDSDLGSGAPIILPDSAGSTNHPHLVVGGGKTSPIYLVDRDNMGRFNGINGNNLIVQQFNGSFGGDRDTTPAFFNNNMYVFDSSYPGHIGAYSITNAQFNTTPVETPDYYDNKGGATATISANGTSNSIVWALYNDGADFPTTPAVLRAYNAANLTQELYTSDTIPSRDSAGDAVKFTTPTVANGKVYVGAQYSVTVYGLASNFVAAPVIKPGGGIFTNSVQVTITETTAGAAVYYTLDGSTPTTTSTLYTGPFLLTKSASVSAAAFDSGAVPSGVTVESFLNSSSIGTGTGLKGQYWANTASSTFIAPGFNTAPTLTRTDPTINFDWSNVAPDPSIGLTVYCVRWTGTVEPQFDETYTFSTSTDDGVLLWVNGQLLVNEWVDQGQTTWSGSIPLLAQQRYNIEMEYYQNGGGAVAQLMWSSPSTGPSVIIPESQLYPVSNPPPSVSITAPTFGSTYTASASVTLTADAAAQFNAISNVSFYSGRQLLGSVTNLPYTITVPGFAAGTYSATAVAWDMTGLVRTSNPVSITVSAGTGLPYGLTNYPATPAFFNMPPVFAGALPTQLSLTGVFLDTPSMTPVAGLIPYAPNVQLWSDGAQKVRYFSIPNSGAPYTTGEQIAFASTGTWTFPAGTVFVKTFELQTNQSDPNSLRRLETRLLVRDTNGAVYGVTYKWRPDYSDADLLTTNLTESIPITTPGGVTNQSWYYPSPNDCLQCHTAVANYVLGVNARQLNNTMTYSNGVTDNELRAINRIGLFNPAFDEATISAMEHLSAVTNTNAPLVERARSYLDANCAQCHQLNGPGPTFDARYDTPLANQNILNTPAVKGNFGYDHVNIVTSNDVWRSSLYIRMNTLDPAIKMPALARNLIDTNAVQLMADWINSLGGTPALPPPTIVPTGGTFQGLVNVTLQPPTNGVMMYYTLDGSLPTTNSLPYTGPFAVTNSATVSANAWEPGFVDSVVDTAQFVILPGLTFVSPGAFTNGVFQMTFAGPAGSNYVLQVSTNLTQWTSISSNIPATTPFILSDPAAPGDSSRFYRVLQTQ